MLRSYCKQDALVVALDGELDHFCAQSVRSQLDEMLADSSVRYLVLDFDKLTFMDSSGIGVILGALPHSAGSWRPHGRLPHESAYRPDLSHVRHGSHYPRAEASLKQGGIAS